MTSSHAPKAFVSYAWEDAEHREWVKELAVKLRLDGVELLLDQWELAPGDELAQFMETSVRNSGHVLLVCTPTFKEKSDARAGGVGYEGSIITAELVTGANRRKFIPILRRGDWKTSSPSWLQGAVYIDFRANGAALEEAYLNLIKALHGRREAAPPVGSPPFPEERDLEKFAAQNENQGQQAEKIHASYPEEPEEASTNPELAQLAALDASSWHFVWSALLRERPGDEELLHQGRYWLKSVSPNHAGWPHIWNTLLRERPGDEELLHQGRYWLKSVSPNHAGWPHVWSALLRERPGDEELLHQGRYWLKSVSPNHAGWPHIWNTLLRERPGDEELLHQGRYWLKSVS